MAMHLSLIPTRLPNVSPTLVVEPQDGPCLGESSKRAVKKAPCDGLPTLDSFKV